MKKIISILLLAAMLFTTFGCSGTVTDETQAVTEILTEENEPETALETETASEPETAPETESETSAESTRVLRKRDDYLYIGVYGISSYARTEQHIKDLADSGVDYVISGVSYKSRETLDLFEKYGVGAIAGGILPSGNSVKAYSEAAANFPDHPAIWGIYYVDEPSAASFSRIGTNVAAIKEARPEQYVYINLFPNYASSDALGVKSYQEYIEAYCQCVPTDNICFDFYPYSWAKRKTKDAPNDGVALLYENFRMVSEACRETGRELWFVGQVNSSRPHTFISTNQIRFQAYTGMAFGAVNIEWACYTAGWWYNHILDRNGEKTEQYDKMKTVNWEVHTIAEEYMKYRNVTTHFVGFTADSPEMVYLSQKPVERLNADVFSEVRADNGATLVIGQMVSRTDDGSYALMISAADDPSDLETVSYNIVFRADNCTTVRAIGGNGELPVTQLEDGSYSVPICSNAGVLLIAK